MHNVWFTWYIPVIFMRWIIVCLSTSSDIRKKWAFPEKSKFSRVSISPPSARNFKLFQMFDPLWRVQCFAVSSEHLCWCPIWIPQIWRFLAGEFFRASGVFLPSPALGNIKVFVSLCWTLLPRMSWTCWAIVINSFLQGSGDSPSTCEPHLSYIFSWILPCVLIFVLGNGYFDLHCLRFPIIDSYLLFLGIGKYFYARAIHSNIHLHVH